MNSIDMNTLADIRDELASKNKLTSVTLEKLEVGYEHDLVVPLDLPFHLPTQIYGAMLAVWHLRPLLQRRFPLHKGKEKDFVRFLAWCVAHGRRQYEILRSIPEWDAALAAPVRLPPLEGDQWRDGYSVAMFLFGIARYFYTEGPILSSASARHRVARAYWRGERHLRCLPPPAEWQCKHLSWRFGRLNTLIETIRLDKERTAKSIQDLQRKFGLDDVRSYFKQMVDGETEVSWRASVEQDKIELSLKRPSFYLPLPVKVIRYFSLLKENFEQQPSEFQLGSVTGLISVKRRGLAKSKYPFGVNLFGYARGELGVGEDVRLVALALKLQNIPFCIVNIQLGENVSQQDRSVEEWISDKPRYAINIFCTTGIEQIRYVCERGLEVFRERYTIGFWPWELPSWPLSCHYAYNTIDEIWGISQYTANAYRSSPQPVYTMSLPVTVDSITGENRAHFGLPENDYLFIFSFDLNSTITRKNPVGVIRAFQNAFPISEGEAVGLVLKASHVSMENSEWRKLKAIINTDPRIYVIDSTLRRPQVLALYRCCDCYVSLHRAEGFGRSLAEALLLDRQLVTTSFSGNLDFCDEQRVGLVKYRRRGLAEGEYFFEQGQYWAEPELEHAAKVMREVYTNPRPTVRRSFDFSPASVGARYAQRLYEIKEQLDDNGAS